MTNKIRSDLDAYRGRPVGDEVWKNLVEGGWVRDFTLTDQPIGRLEEEARRLERSLRQKLALLVPPTRGRINSRNEALSLVLALDAERDSRLQNFRNKVLQGRLIQEEQIGEWIRGQLDRAPSAHPRVLTYPDEHGHVAYVRVDAAGPLGDLKNLAERLVDRYRWQEAQATAFVLTGLAPLVEEVGAEIAWRNVILTGFPAAPGMPTSALARLVLTIDPRLSPKAVARAYQQERRRFVPRHRDQSAKHLRLGLFALQRAADEPWSSVLDRWNQAAPAGHRYKRTNLANFERDCLKAIQRLLQPDYRS